MDKKRLQELAGIREAYTEEQRKKFTEKVKSAIEQYTSSMAFGGGSNDALIHAALELYPELRYTGKMYRVLGIGFEDFLGFNSNTDVLNYIKNYKGYKPKHYKSFSKTVAGVEEFDYLTTSGDIESFEPSIGIIIEQVGSGLDVEVFYKKFIDKDFKSYIKEDINPRTKSAAAVGEIIAPLDTQTIQIGMYVLHQPTQYKVYKYPTSKFKQLKDDLKDAVSEYEETNSDSEDYKEPTEKTRKGFRRFPDSNTYTHKSFHKKSKYKKYNSSSYD